MKRLSECLVFVAVFFIPFYFFRFSVFGIPTNIFEISVLVALISSFLIPRKDISTLNEITKFTGWIFPILLLIIALVSSFLAGDKTNALGIFKGWFLVPAIFAWLITKNFNQKNLWKLSIPLYVGLLIISIWSIFQKLGIIGALFYQAGDSSFSQYLQERRVFGPFESPNFLAMYLVPALLISFSIIEHIKYKCSKILLAVSVVLPVLALYFSGSRAGLITLILGALVYLNYRFIDVQKTKYRKPFFAVLFIFLFLLINVGYLFFATKYFQPEAGSSDDIRVQIYKYSETLIRNHPVAGIGLGQFQTAIAEISKSSTAFQEFGLPYALHPHNLFLALWLNLGTYGLISFVLLLVAMFKNLYFNDSKLKAYFIAAVFAILIHGLFDSTYFKNDLSAIFWLIFAAGVILKQNETKKLAE